VPDDTSAKIAIIIPALNEEDAIKHLLTEIPPHQAQWIIVVDNGSSDRTAQVARAAGAHVVSEPQRGYGRACYSGSVAAQQLGAEILVFMDGDGSDNPQDISTMLAPILAGQADLAIGARNSNNAEQGAIPMQARLGNWLVSHLISLLYSAHLRDIGSFRVIRTEKLLALQMCEMNFGWPVEMLVKAARARYRIIELPIHYRCRSHGRSKVAGTIAGSIRAAYAMLTITLRYAGTRETHV
jgi:glycosyltransferase involved in cell wall biosynthesis